MSDKKITELTNITGANLADADEFVVVDSSASETKAITYGELKNINGNLNFADNGKAIFGAGSDLQIYHSGSGSYITDSGTGNLYLSGDNLRVTTADGLGFYFTADNGGASTIYHNASPKLATTSTGVDVTGTVTADGLTVDGNPVISNASPQLFFQTGVTHYNWQIAAQESENAAFEIASGSQDADATNDTYTKRLLVGQSGDISFYEDTGTTPKFFWDASEESLTIGTVVNPQVPLNVSAATVGSSNAIAFLRNSSVDGNGLVVDVTNTPTDYVADFRIGNSSKVRIDSSGRVGIGTTSPALQSAGQGLHIHGATNSEIKFTNTTTGSAATDGTALVANGSNFTINNREAGNLQFNTNNTERLRITSSGSVGINTTAPVSELEVAGTITADAYDLDAIAASKAVTAVDVFVYNTSKDSDGGAWRKRTQHTSWYNETLNTATRGSRREFPAVAVIVAESNKVTIYDGDDPALPMWMVFNGNGNYAFRSDATAISALNGVICVSTSAGKALQVFKFIADYTYLQSVPQYERGYTRIVDRNVAGTWVSVGGASIVDTNVNDVAMTVLPDAPIDPATGLPVPTIWVATEAGISQIGWDGSSVNNVWDRTHVSGFSYIKQVIALDGVGFAYYGDTVTSYGRFYHEVHHVLTADEPLGHIYSGANSDVFYHSVQQSTYTNEFGKLLPTSTVGARFIVDGAIGSAGGLNLIKPLEASTSLLAYTTSTYNTGWMNGDIKGAFLSSTDATSLVGSGELAPDLTAYADQAAAVADGWSTVEAGWTFDAANDQWVHDGSANSNIRYDTLPLLDGVDYYLSFDVVNAGQVTAYVGTGSEAGSYALNLSSGSHGLWLKAGTQGDYIQFRRTSGAPSVKNISLYRGDADRSVNNKGLIVNGTVTRSAVATGAELVAYSGFSSSNYLEQPYNSALDFGTGDFCIMGWVNVAYDTWGIIVDRYTGSSGRFSLGYTPSGSSAVAEFYINGFRHQGTTLLGSTWRHVTLVRSSGVASLYVDGVLDASFSRTEDVTSSTSAPLIIGKRYDNVQQADQSADIALLRISATAPTAEQIKKIYEDEKVLFQENAACTLYGASDAVTALAHDSDTGLLHVGTSAGRSVFQGLRRVSNTTTAVGTAISASNGLVVEE